MKEFLDPGGERVFNGTRSSTVRPSVRPLHSIPLFETITHLGKKSVSFQSHPPRLPLPPSPFHGQAGRDKTDGRTDGHGTGIKGYASVPPSVRAKTIIPVRSVRLSFPAHRIGGGREGGENPSFISFCSAGRIIIRVTSCVTKAAARGEEGKEEENAYKQSLCEPQRYRDIDAFRGPHVNTCVLARIANICIITSKSHVKKRKKI